jgi:hypothetical protein
MKVTPYANIISSPDTTAAVMKYSILYSLWFGSISPKAIKILPNCLYVCNIANNVRIDILIHYKLIKYIISFFSYIY